MAKADYTIMLVDDNITYGKTIREQAFDDFNIELDPYEDWETAYDSLKSKPGYYQALILDAKGKVTHDDSTESMKHILTAVENLKKLEGQGFFIPYVINTGFIEDSVVQNLPSKKIFSKGDEVNMFNYLITQIKILPETRLRIKYENVLCVFGENGLPNHLEKKFINILHFAENPSIKEDPDDFLNQIRKILESIFYKLKEHRVIDDRCFTNEKINLKNCIDCAAGNRVQISKYESFPGTKIIPSHIYYLMCFVRDLTSILSHEYSKSNDLTPFCLRSVTNSLCEILWWFRNYTDNIKTDK